MLRMKILVPKEEKGFILDYTFTVGLQSSALSLIYIRLPEADG